MGNLSKKKFLTDVVEAISKEDVPYDIYSSAF